VAGSERLYACGDGSDRGLLEAGVAELATRFGKRGTGEECAWSQERCYDATWVRVVGARLVRASFVPEPAIQQLGGLLRVTRTKATYLHAQFVRLRGRRGPKKAICAVAASILTAAYHMLKAMKISGPFTSIVGGPKRKRAASSNASPNSVFPSNSSPRRLSHEQSVSL
jgi:hypothetical protein